MSDSQVVWAWIENAINRRLENKMSNEFLRELKVTDGDLAGIQNNWLPYVRLTPRQKEIIDEAPDDGTVLFLDRHAAWRAWCGNEREPGVIYRLHPDLLLPSEKPKRPEDPREPFKHTVDDRELWCCPVYPDDGMLTYSRPGTNGGYLVTGAANYVDFAGTSGADEYGMPTGYMEHDVSIALAYHHENGGDQKVAFVCFETGDK